MSEHIFQASLPLRLDGSKPDLFGHINNVIISKFIQASWFLYWAQKAIDTMNNEDGIGHHQSSNWETVKTDF